MGGTRLEPLENVEITPAVASVPKADLHLHQEVFPRLDRIVARQQRRAPYPWGAWAREVMATVPAGPRRLDAIYQYDHELGVHRSLDSDSHLFISRVADILEEAAADGAIYVEVRFGADRLLGLPDFMPLFRAAEERVQSQYPALHGEAIGYVEVWEEILRAAKRNRTNCTPVCAHPATDSQASISSCDRMMQLTTRSCGGPLTSGRTAPRRLAWGSLCTWASSEPRALDPRSALPVCGALATAHTLPMMVRYSTN